MPCRRQPLGNIRPPQLLCSQRRAIEKFTAPMRLAHEHRAGIVRVKGPGPIASIHQRLAPCEARLWPLRLSRESLEAIHALQANIGLTEPLFVVALPFILRGPATREMIHPSRQERTKIRQRPCRHPLHLADRVQNRADGFDVLNRLEHGTDSVRQGRGRVHARHVLRNACVNVDTQNIVNQLVLAEIDGRGGYGDQKCLEYGSSTCVIASQKGLGGQSQMFTHVVRIGVPHLLSGVRERPGIVNDSGRRTIRLPAGVAPGCTGHQRVDHPSSLLGLEFVQHAAHECAQLRSRHGLEGPDGDRCRPIEQTAFQNADGPSFGSL